MDGSCEPMSPTSIAARHRTWWYESFSDSMMAGVNGFMSSTFISHTL